jgi:hypothetical protein
MPGAENFFFLLLFLLFCPSRTVAIGFAPQALYQGEQPA